MKGTVSRDFIVFLPILTVRWYFLLRYFFVKSIKIGPLISHIFRITNHRSLFLLKTSIYIQIVIRWASIHRLSICIINLPTTVIIGTKAKRFGLVHLLLERKQNILICSKKNFIASRSFSFPKILGRSIAIWFGLEIVLGKVEHFYLIQKLIDWSQRFWFGLLIIVTKAKHFDLICLL